jgi:HSP20 family protein
MKTERFYDRPSEKWVPAAIDSLLVDRPLSSLLGNNFFSSFDSNVLETADGYTLEIAVPGMKKKDLRLEAADGVLTVQGQRQQRDVFGWLGRTVEFKSTQIYRSFALPEDADADRIQAKCRDGLLKISIPKIKSQRTFRVIPIEPVEAPGKMSWWQKLARPFKRLKTKVGYMMKRLGFGSNRRRTLLS